MRRKKQVCQKKEDTYIHSQLCIYWCLCFLNLILFTSILLHGRYECLKNNVWKVKLLLDFTFSSFLQRKQSANISISVVFVSKKQYSRFQMLKERRGTCFYVFLYFHLELHFLSVATWDQPVSKQIVAIFFFWTILHGPFKTALSYY